MLNSYWQHSHDTFCKFIKNKECAATMSTRTVVGKPVKPVKKRRDKADFYEMMTFIGLVASGITGFVILLENPTGASSDDRTMALRALIGTTVVCGLMLIKFDRTAVNRGAIIYESELKEYEMLRTKWLEFEAKRMEAAGENVVESYKAKSSSVSSTADNSVNPTPVMVKPEESESQVIVIPSPPE